MLRGRPPVAADHGLRHGTVPDSRALIMRLVIASYTSWLLILISPSGLSSRAGGLSAAAGLLRRLPARHGGRLGRPPGRGGRHAPGMGAFPPAQGARPRASGASR